MFTEEEWQRFLKYFDILKTISSTSLISVRYSRERGIVEYIARDGKTIVRTEHIKDILNSLPHQEPSS
ncbi:MAG: hypothetical protein A3J54_00745 [Candidatus Ryanbacteria bacterium RIFCSPHIGHO2_02_FULL_45_13b]|uniref:Uncharacterized protein n=1 Tax=Candidatus Ryanbacteria bacterium RIFCSPHIGHO2_02_FULL_45_13b TaxID=1802117 RepID=A0A1G2G5Q0_9BACT|nr:MAG: hypothetical protein A3J54_00745 [Candidatus Ryanbacteria bacterium RIFCSPHIGHO2_02_FULL_45_13b]